MGRYIAAAKAGRGANGYEKDRGSVRHAIELTGSMTEKDIGYSFYYSLCGTRPGGRSMGWSTLVKQADEVSCRACKRILDKRSTNT